MRKSPGYLALKSLSFQKHSTIYQVLIIMLLSAVITGSLLTGKSVRMSLRKTSAEKLGNTGLVISTGPRYFNHSLAERIQKNAGIKTASILEINGYCQRFGEGPGASGVNIIAVDSVFFSFHGKENAELNQGMVLINWKLAELLGVKEGDEIIVRYPAISEIPSDSPFSPGRKNSESAVMTVKGVLSTEDLGDFSLSISQIKPLNLFINRSDIADIDGNVPESNRMLIERKSSITASQVLSVLGESLMPGDIGLKIRHSERDGTSEIISGRVFIDQNIVDGITKVIPSASPVLTYLGNMFIKGTAMTPYSFVSGLPNSLYKDMPAGDSILINQWLAADLGAKTGDTIEIRWYSPDIANRMTIRSGQFIVSGIAGMGSRLSDPSLMPEFAGISGKESCSEWDAGVPVDLNLIREKDEDYWNTYKGTPKAFISYKKASELWGSNYGPVTSLRFPAGISEEDIISKLTGSLDPEKTGFTVTDVSGESIRAAVKGTDFSTLFLSLGFFIILSAVILLVLVVSAFLETRKDHVRTLSSLGFTDSWIGRMLFTESVFVASAGAAAGIFAGIAFNKIIIQALNTVWHDTVQTDTIITAMGFWPLAVGFITTIITSLVILNLKRRRFLRDLRKPKTGSFRLPSGKKHLIFSSLALMLSIMLAIMSSFFPGKAMLLSFAGGALMLISIVMLSGYINFRRSDFNTFRNPPLRALSGFYYSFFPSNAIIPVVFIAAGIFAIMVTGLNRLAITGQSLEESGGTGGYLLWNTVTVPVMDDLNSDAGRSEFALNESGLEELEFVHVKLLPGDDASCLNLNNVTSPPLLGINPDKFIERGSFSFASVMRNLKPDNPWASLNLPGNNNTIFGIADQTVLQWGLKIKTGDTLIVRSENGEPLRIVIAAGLKSSIFQGNIIIGFENFNRYFPSISGSHIFLADGNPEMIDLYREVMIDRFSGHGIQTEETAVRMASFFKVTNTYLTVFSILGGIGLIMGVAGLGFVLLRNYNQRKRDFAFMLASGFNIYSIRKLISGEQVRILISGIAAGVPAAFIATLPSLGSASGVPWKVLIINVILVFITGLLSLSIAVRSIRQKSLIKDLRRE